MSRKILYFIIILIISLLLDSCKKEDIIVNELDCTVNFNSCYEENSKSVKLKKGEKISTYSPTRLNYELDGWYFDDCYSIPFDFNVKINADITLYAKWNYVGEVEIQPSIISINNIEDLLQIDEIKNLFKTGKDNSKSFDYYEIKGVIAEIIDYDNGEVKLLVNDEKIFIKGFNSSFSSLKLRIGDEITIRSLITYCNKSIFCNDAEIISINRIKHYITAIIEGEIQKFDISAYGLLTDLPDPQITDTTFDGWFFDEDYVYKLPTDYSFFDDIVIFAKVTHLPFVYINAHVLEDINVYKDLYEVSFDSVVTPNNDDYLFEGFFFEDTFETLVPENTIFNKSVDIYAKMTKIIRHTVTFNIDGTISSILVVEGTTLSTNLVVSPKKDHYSFDGWYTEDSFTNAFNIDDIIMNDLVLYAKFSYITNIYKVNVVINNETKAYDVNENSSISQFTSLYQELSDVYHFNGWFFDKEYKKLIDDNYVFTSDLTIYAKLSKVLIYKVKMVINNETEVQQIRDDVLLASCSFISLTFNDYYFDGWFFDDSYQNKVNTNVYLSSDIIIYAKLRLIPYYNVDIYSNGNKFTTYSIKENTSITKLIKPSKNSDDYAKYSFGGWYLDDKFSLPVASSYTITEDVSLFVKYNENRFYHVTTVIDGVSSVVNLDDTNNLISKIRIPSKSDDDYHYTFDKWYFDKDYKNEVSKDYVFTETYTFIYASFTKTPFYIVTASIQGNKANYKVLSGKTIYEIPAPSVSNYYFSGWYLDKDFTTSVSNSYVVDKNIAIFAKFIKIIDVKTVVINKSTDYSLYEGDKIDKINDPVVEDYRFEGWFTDNNFTSKIKDDYVFVEDSVIYAKMTPIIYFNVTAYLDTTTSKTSNISKSLKIAEHTLLENIDKPIVKGYVFDCWCIDKYLTTPFENNYMVDNNVTIYARFIPKEDTKYLVRYHLETEKEGIYQIDKQVSKKGTSGAIVAVDLINYDYYKPINEIFTETINGNGSTIVDVYYDRLAYKVTYLVKGNIYVSSFEDEQQLMNKEIKWGHKVSYITRTLFEEFFLDGWFIDDKFSKINDYETMPIGGITLYGKTETIYKGSSGLVYELNEMKDGYIVIGYEGDDKEIIVPNGYSCLPVREIAACAFMDKDIISLTMSNYITKINSYAFKNCDKLKQVILSDNIADIGNECFMNCSALKEIILPSKLMVLGNSPFYGCNSIGNISLDNCDNYKVIDNVLYNNDLSILVYYAAGKNDAEFIINSSVKEVSSNAFNSCALLQKLNTNKVIKIDSFAFNMCKSLSEIFINKSVEQIDNSFIYNCKALQQINVDDNNSMFSSIDGVLYNKNKEELLYYPSNKKDVEFIIPQFVRYVAYNAFQYNDKISSVIINDSLKKVAYYGFYECSNLVITCNFSEIPLLWNKAWNYHINKVVLK